MKKLFFIYIIFCSFPVFGQNTENLPSPPPGSGDINKQPEKDKIFYKVDEKIKFNTKNLSDSFDYSVIDSKYKPTENVFVVSFISEVHKNISNLKVEIGKDDMIIRELKRLLLRYYFNPASVNGWFVRSYCKMKFIFDYNNNSMKVILL
ncbi:hypothetical protein BAS10_18495 [Elizabethkingia meningoseptica]|uniref:hypothetical protein n=1 Tax=Elizabethkingia meningoseptica TaxID=238 RepID=UPI000999BB96|nr:hypothetical protein [Elizabethkingia meningoseptica]OPC01934.1 hypothetical protein BAS10_18495 [Elizabethkingia meningoseptica]